MKRKLILLLLLLFSTPYLLSAQTIKNIEIYGNKRLSEQVVRSYLQTKPGLQYRKDVMDNDIAKLIETGFFKKVRYQESEKTEEEIVIKIYLEENPTISDIKFVGNKVFSAKKLKGFIDIKKGDIYNEIKLKTSLDKIEEKYKDKGFTFTKTEGDASPLKEEVLITINIKEGTKPYIRKISFDENIFFTPTKIKKLMKTKERSMPFKKGTFKTDILEQDIYNITNLYMNSGFLDAEVNHEFLEHEKGGLILKLNIDTDKRYFLGNIGFKGTLYAEEETLINQLELKTEGTPLNRSLLEKNQKKLSEFYLNKGYIASKITEIPLPSDKPDVMNITYFIEPGNIYKAGEIKIVGNTKTKDKVIRRELKVEPSNTITSSDILKSFNNLYDLNYFEKINIYPEFTEQQDIANVIVDVIERDKTGVFLIGGGYSSVDNLIGMISVQQSNFDISNPWSFQGGGQDLQLSFEFGTEAKNYRLSFTEPYFLDKPIWVGFDIYGTKREWRDYTEERKGLALRAGRKWENLSLGFNLKTEAIDLYDVNVARIPSIVSQEGKNRKNSLTATLTHSSLDRRRAPSKGNLAKISLESAGGPLQGDINFTKAVLENDFYYPIKNFTFRSRTYAGFIEETKKSEDIPIYERFFGGGIGTVRGYKERSIGPKDPTTDEPVGGKALFAQNFELVYPIYQDTLKGVFFCDIGNVWDSFGDFSDLRKGAGAGVKFVVPILNAPIEIYYGIALDKKPTDANGRWHVGMSFGF